MKNGQEYCKLLSLISILIKLYLYTHVMMAFCMLFNVSFYEIAIGRYSFFLIYYVFTFTFHSIFRNIFSYNLLVHDYKSD